MCFCYYVWTKHTCKVNNVAMVTVPAVTSCITVRESRLRVWRCAVVQLQMYTAEKDVITSKSDARQYKHSDAPLCLYLLPRSTLWKINRLKLYFLQIITSVIMFKLLVRSKPEHIIKQFPEAHLPNSRLIFLKIWSIFLSCNRIPMAALCYLLDVCI